MKKKPKYYHCKTWRAHIYYFIGWNKKDFDKYMLKKYSLDVSNECSGCVVFYQEEGTEGLFIFTEKKTKYPIIAHECLHAANRILQARGVEADFLNDEAQAYLLTELMEEALNGK